jgi:4-oxalmesaconate hydratase
MIIDCHGHYTTVAKEVQAFRDSQIRGESPKLPQISDDQIRESVQPQLAFQAARGTDLTIFSPRASSMGHHVGDRAANQQWARLCNDLIHRVCSLFPKQFVGVGQLPQTVGGSPAECVDELERSVRELGFIGCNLNPDPSGGHWASAPLTDRAWYPLYEKLVELDVPAMVHVSASCNPNFHATGAHYLNADTTAFMQFLTGDLFTHFPTLRFVIPHGGGAVPYHWGRYRGLAQDMKRPPLTELIRDNVFFDTCVYHLPGIELLLKVVPIDNVVFGSEMVGAVRGIDPETGHYFDDTKRYVDQVPALDAGDRKKLFELNARKVYPRISPLIDRAAPAPRTAV